MNSTALRYMDFLQIKLSVLEDIHKNTVAQSNALERKDYNLLGKLLKDRQGCIENLARIVRSSADYDGMKKNEEMVKWEQTVDYLFQEIININAVNTEKAENQRNDMASAVRSLKLGRYAIQNGYFKKMPQRYGYFIDKKIGR